MSVPLKNYSHVEASGIQELEHFFWVFGFVDGRLCLLHEGGIVAPPHRMPNNNGPAAVIFLEFYDYLLHRDTPFSWSSSSSSRMVVPSSSTPCTSYQRAGSSYGGSALASRSSSVIPL